MNKNIQEALVEVSRRLQNHSETPVLDAQVLLASILNKPRTWVMAHPESQLDTSQLDQLNRSMSRLEHGEPLPYVIGHWEFYSLDFELTPDVLIPRPETELLVEEAIKWLLLHPEARRAIDVGTGSGCIGITLAMHIPDLHMTLTDISQPALAVARNNTNKFNLSNRLELLQADLLEGVEATFDLVCANLPYIPSQILGDLDVSKREPWLALEGGEKGSEQITRLIDQSRKHLVPGGLMLLEIDESQGSEVEISAQAFYPASNIQLLKDLAGRERCLRIERSKLIIHLCLKNQWQKAQAEGVLVEPSLDQEGFIHCSQPDQILQVANRFYRGIADLILLWIDPSRLASEIRWEMADQALFPHVYGPINLESVVAITELEPGQDGIYAFLQVPA